MLVPYTPEEIIERVRRRLSMHGVRMEGRISRRTITLTVSPEETHFWSPHLDVQLEDAPGGARVFGTLAPHPNVWFGFLMLQALFGLLALATGIYAFGQWTVGQPSWLSTGLWAAMMVGGGLAYGAAYVGQGIGSNQMYELRAFLDSALRDEAGSAS
jgi:hypothetical protein